MPADTDIKRSEEAKLTNGVPSQAVSFSNVQKDVDDITNLMSKNIEIILQRGENLDTLQGRSEDLEEGTKEFKKVAKEAKWKGCCNLCKSRCKTIAMIVGAIIVLTLALALVLLGMLKPWQGSGTDD